MKVLNLLYSGGIGGIEVLCENIGKYADYDNTFCFLFEEGIIYEEMLKENLDVISLVNKEKKEYLKKFLQLKKIINNYDVIITHHANISMHLYFLLICILYRKSITVMTIHSCFEEQNYFNYNNRLKNILFKPLIKANLKLSKALIFVSNAGKSSYKNYFNFDDNKAHIVYNGIENKQFEFSTRRKEDEINKSFNITYIGRLVEIKGVHILIDAIKLLINEKISVDLKIIGDGDYRSKLEEKVKKNNLNEIVKFEGEQRTLVDYLKNTDIFIYPSICQEVFGISIVEAMAFGIPCIGFNVGGIPEIIKNNYNGIVVDDISAKGLANGIKEIINNYQNEGIVQIKQNCLETANSFSINNTVSKLKQVLYELMST